MTLKNVLVVDDHGLFRMAFCKFLESIFDPSPVCDQAIHGYDALDKIKSKGYDVMFLDVSMPTLNGVGLNKIMSIEKIFVPTIMLTQYDDVSLVQYFMNHGASGFLNKNACSSEVCNAVEAALRGGKYVQTEVMSRIENCQPPGSVSLTYKEQKLIQLLSIGFTSKEISIKMGLTTKTIDTYRERLLDKTRTKNTAELVSFSYRTGIFFIEQIKPSSTSEKYDIDNAI